MKALGDNILGDLCNKAILIAMVAIIARLIFYYGNINTILRIAFIRGAVMVTKLPSLATSIMPIKS